MRRKAGQSLVEMALLLPLMIILLFGIIDLGWYVYGYASIFQAVRNGSEAAASLPPFESMLPSSPRRFDDPCYITIVEAVKNDATMFADISDYVEVRYPASSLSPKRAVGNPIEVAVTYKIQPLTPLFQLVPLGDKGIFTVKASSVRSIEALGNTPFSDKYPNGIVCLQ